MPRPPLSLKTLAASEDPLTDLPILIARLEQTSKENRYLEWKQHPALGRNVTQRAKYRMVKAAISFANSEGGFILFGVAPDGQWVGLQDSELSEVDPASISELINGCLVPEIPNLNYADFEHNGLLMAVLHVPPSRQAPHVTSKEIFEKDPTGRLKVILQKYSVYARQGAKSDLATPQHHHQIIARRIEQLREELLRRVKEVQVPVLVPTSQGQAPSPPATITATRLTSDPNALPVRLTRRQEGTAGILLHEELSDGIFEEINNVVDANAFLAAGRDTFVLGESVYYRIYAERQHVDSSETNLQLLAWTGLHDYYAPNLYWFLRMPPEATASIIKRAAEGINYPQVNGLIRLTVLLGSRASDWLWNKMESLWGSHAQPPEYFWGFKRIRDIMVTDVRLAALRMSARSAIELPGSQALTAETLLGNALDTAALLSPSCVEVFQGSKNFRQTARYLDVLAYGLEINSLGDTVAAKLESEET